MDFGAEGDSGSIPPSVADDQRNSNPPETINGDFQCLSLVQREQNAATGNPLTTVNGVHSDSSLYQGGEEAVDGEHPLSSVSPAVADANAAEEVHRSSSIVRGRNNPEVELEGPSSPCSSGYAGTKGSLCGTSGAGIYDVRESGDFEADPDNGANWTTGKRHLEEDEGSVLWRNKKKHFFVLSDSGKPVYSRYGDEHRLAGFSATLQAIISFVQKGGDHVNFVRAGNHQVIFLVKGPIYLVCISCTEEPYEALRGQLEFLYGQIILILTKSVERCFEKNPQYDMKHLLGGTDAVFSSLIRAFSWNPAAFLHAYTCLPLANSTRQAAGAVLQDVADSGVLFAILMCKNKEQSSGRTIGNAKQWNSLYCFNDNTSSGRKVCGPSGVSSTTIVD